MSNDLTQSKADRLQVHDTGEFANLLDTARFEHLWRLSTAFAKSTMVPAHFHGHPENVFVAMQMALRVGVDPYMFLQNCYVIQGKPGIETKLAIALLNRSGRIKGSLKYRFEGDGKTLACVAYCVEHSTGEILEHRLDWRTVEAEGWTKKSGSKWLTDPTMMMQYRAAMRLIRLHFPEVLLGMSSVEEAEELATIDVAPTAKRSRSASNGTLAKRLEIVAAKGEEKPPEPEPEAEHGDAWEPDAEERAQIERQLFDTHPNAAEA